MADHGYGVVQNRKRQSQPQAQSRRHHRQRDSPTGMASDSRGWHRTARRHQHSGPVLEEGRPWSGESSRDSRSSCIKATGLPRPLYEEASCRSWALPCEWLSVPWRPLEHHVVSEEDACQCALSVCLRSSPRGCRLPSKCKP